MVKPKALYYIAPKNGVEEKIHTEISVGNPMTFVCNDTMVVIG